MANREVDSEQSEKREGRQQGHRRPTLADVARDAKVSTATVSRFFSAPDAVSPALRGPRHAAVTNLGYTPDVTARALVTGRTYTLGFVIPKLDVAPFAAGVQAFQSCLAQAEYTSLLAYSNYDLAEEARQVRALVSRGVEGIVMTGLQHESRLEEFLLERKVPFVQHLGLRT